MDGWVDGWRLPQGRQTDSIAPRASAAIASGVPRRAENETSIRCLRLSRDASARWVCCPHRRPLKRTGKDLLLPRDSAESRIVCWITSLKCIQYAKRRTLFNHCFAHVLQVVEVVRRVGHPFPLNSQQFAVVQDALLEFFVLLRRVGVVEPAERRVFSIIPSLLLLLLLLLLSLQQEPLLLEPL